VNGDLERRVDSLVAPLGAISPARRDRGRPVVRRHAVLAAVAAVVLVLLAAGATWAAIELTATPDTTPVSPGGRLACLGLVGGRADHARQVLDDRGYPIQWRLVTYNPPDGATWTATAAADVPADSVVERVAASATGVLVFVHRADDAYAPVPRPSTCDSG
jgi:hypothetical protein